MCYYWSQSLVAGKRATFYSASGEGQVILIYFAFITAGHLWRYFWSCWTNPCPPGNRVLPEAAVLLRQCDCGHSRRAAALAPAPGLCAGSARAHSARSAGRQWQLHPADRHSAGFLRGDEGGEYFLWSAVMSCQVWQFESIFRLEMWERSDLYVTK